MVWISSMMAVCAFWILFNSIIRTESVGMFLYRYISLCSVSASEKILRLSYTTFVFPFAFTKMF